jgi:23S rRNA pseudouridine2605 synthase
MTRLNKYLSICGVTSRRGAEALIEAGRVAVNGTKVTTLGVIIDENADKVTVDGLEVSPVTESEYVLFNKPRNVMTTLRDPFGRRTIVHYLKKMPNRVYPIGRLDFDTEGVLLLTNDGDLAYRLAHPKYQVQKVYEAKVEGHFKPEDVERIQKGVKLKDGATGRATVNILGFASRFTRIRLTLTEGRKHEVKELCSGVGHPVVELRRVEFAGITTRNLEPGNWRRLNRAEVEKLRSLVGLRDEAED